MALDWADIDHITKVDPAKVLPEELGILRATDLIMVGGSDDVTVENTLDAVQRITDEVPDVPVCQEPYTGRQVSEATIDAVDHVTVPAVYNGDRDHFVAKHLSFFTELARKPETVTGADLPLLGDLITAKGREVVTAVSEKIVPEGYVIQNLESKAAIVTGVDEQFTPEQVAGAALATESFYRFPIFYVEYSGMYGGPEDVEAAATYLADTVLLYGGGIKTNEQATEILEAGADAIVVGDCFHEDPERFRETIPS